MYYIPVATNLAIDDRVLRAAQRIGRHRTKKATVMEALREYIQRRKQLQAIGLFGTVVYDKGHDYKAQRRLR